MPLLASAAKNELHSQLLLWRAGAASQRGSCFSLTVTTSNLKHGPLAVWPLHSSYAMSFENSVHWPLWWKPMGRECFELISNCSAKVGVCTASVVNLSDNGQRCKRVTLHVAASPCGAAPRPRRCLLSDAEHSIRGALALNICSDGPRAAREEAEP